MTQLFVDSTRRLGLAASPAGALIVQSFDDQTLREVARALPGVPRTFLIEGRDGARWLSPEGLAEVARFATGAPIRSSRRIAVRINNGRGAFFATMRQYLWKRVSVVIDTSTNQRIIHIDTHELSVACWYLQRSFRFFL